MNYIMRMAFDDEIEKIASTKRVIRLGDSRRFAGPHEVADAYRREYVGKPIGRRVAGPHEVADSYRREYVGKPPGTALVRRANPRTALVRRNASMVRYVPPSAPSTRSAYKRVGRSMRAGGLGLAAAGLGAGALAAAGAHYYSGRR